MPSNAEAALAAKAEGNAFIKKGDLDAAIAAYTTGIDLEPSPALHSNRAIAWLKKGDATRALADADACMALDKTFVKAYSSKASALLQLGRRTEALAAINAGLANVGPDKAALLRARLDEFDDAAASAGAGAGTGSAGGAAAATTANRPSLGSVLCGSSANVAYTMQSLLRIVIVVSAVMYLLPFASHSSYFRRAIVLSIANVVLTLLNTHGRPRFNKLYGARLVQDPMLSHLFFALLFLNSRPYALILFPICSFTAVHVCDFVHRVAVAAAPGAAAALEGWADAAGIGLVGESPREWQKKDRGAKWFAFNTALSQSNAYMEVGFGLLLILELLTPFRNILTMVLYWQFLRLRAMTTASTKQAFSTLDAAIRTGLSGRLVPGVLLTVYSKFAGWAANLVALPKPGEKVSPFSGCSVM